MFFKRYKIEGHSMEPRYPRGSHVLVHKTKRVHAGDVIAFRLENDPNKVLIKRIQKENDDDSFVVSGDNPGDSFNPGAVCRDEIIGRVVLSY